MIRHADSLILVWKLAELEARHLRNGEIEPAHFFLGLLKIVDLDVVRLAENWQAEGRDSVEQLSADVGLLRSIFTEFFIETTPLRRRLRSRLSKGVAEEKETLRRSRVARTLFRKAELMGSEIVRPDHLLVAILETDVPEVSRVLADSGIDRERLTRDFQHVGVPDGISEDRVRSAPDHLADRSRLAFSAGHPDDLVRNLPILGGNRRRQNPAGWNSEVLHSCLDDPFAGGGNRPDLAAHIV